MPDDKIYLHFLVCSFTFHFQDNSPQFIVVICKQNFSRFRAALKFVSKYFTEGYLQCQGILDTPERWKSFLSVIPDESILCLLRSDQCICECVKFAFLARRSVISHAHPRLHERLLLLIWTCTCDLRFVYPLYIELAYT